MTKTTGIEWTDQTWNPSTGCSKVSEGCKFCYAETMAHRPERVEWVRSIQRRCADQGVAFFFKQWGGPTSKAAGRRLDGTVYDEFPGNTSGMLAAGE